MAAIAAALALRGKGLAPPVLGQTPVADSFVSAPEPKPGPEKVLPVGMGAIPKITVKPTINVKTVSKPQILNILQSSMGNE